MLQQQWMKSGDHGRILAIVSAEDLGYQRLIIPETN